MTETIYTKDVVANIQAVAEQLKDEGCDAEAQTLREAAEYIAITDSGLQNVLATLDVVRAEASVSLSREAALVEALAPFVKAAEIIEKRPNDYKDRIAMVGGLGEPADLHKRHFAALLAATR